MIRIRLFAGASLVAMAAAAPSWAQEANVEQVTVSASRIAVAGYTAPTPVTVVNAEQLQRDAKSNIGDAIRELPSVGTAIGPTSATNAGQNGGTQGLDFLNLRQLGVSRTLVLFNGQRVVNSVASGGVDLSTMPSSLIQRVDIVTGGASAAWGSDAVAGVVNLILNKNFNGLSANLQGAMSYKADAREVKAEASFGTDFAGGRGHFILSGAYTMAPDAVFLGDRDFAYNTHLFPNPAYVAGNGQPKLIHVTNVGQSQATRGGLILGCGTIAAPNTSVNCSLKYTQFIGPEATPTTFIPGQVSGAFCTGSSSSESAAYSGNGNPQSLMFTLPRHTFTFFNYNRFNLTDNITASLELEYGQNNNKATSTLYMKLGNQIIQADNPFLPQVIKDRMAAGGYSTVFLGTNDLNGAIPSTKTDIPNKSFSAIYQTLGTPVAFDYHQTYRSVFTLDGTLGSDWTWNAYVQHGMGRGKQNVPHNVITANYTRAVDAVTVTAANVGTSGLQIGSVACRSTLTAPTNGCVPLNVFGEHDVSAGAMNYITNTAVVGGQYTTQALNQDVAAASMTGELPAEWSLPAGRIAVAFGAETRKEGFRQGPTDPTALAIGYNIGNFGQFAGHYEVTEGFGEVTIPVLKNNVVQSLELNAAGRITDYSTSGMVETWKMGATSQVNDDIRLRATMSFDIRAPNINELFSTGTCGQGTNLNPFNLQNVNSLGCSGGNANLVPEQSTTVSGGAVLTPTFLGLDGLSLSADWYSITIKKAITTISATTITTLCSQGQQLYCNQVSFTNGILTISATPINANVETTSGLDFQGDYKFDFMAGSVNLHAVGNYTDEETRLAQGVFQSYAGQLGMDASAQGLPKFKGQLAATYDAGDWQVTVQGRFIGAAKLNNAWVQGVDVDNNNVPPVAYLDLRGSYNYNENMTIYGAIDNVSNVPPQATPSTTEVVAGFRGQIYDNLGRMFRAGIRLRY